MMNVESTINQVEKLYRNITGREIPPSADEGSFRPIPPEVDPQQHIEEQVERLTAALDSMTRGFSSGREPWVPALSVFEGEDEYVYLFDVPGVAKEDLQVSVENGAVVVTGRRSFKTERKGGALAQRWGEARETEFYRAVRLPGGMEPDEIDARVENGVLELRLPKRATSSSARTIAVA